MSEKNFKKNKITISVHFKWTLMSEKKILKKIIITISVHFKWTLMSEKKN
jgi:hypothetical protein